MTTNDLSFLPRAKWHLLHGVAATPSSSQGSGCDGEGAAATSGYDGAYNQWLSNEEKEMGHD